MSIDQTKHYCFSVKIIVRNKILNVIGHLVLLAKEDSRSNWRKISHPDAAIHGATKRANQIEKGCASCDS
jgi:hypothetical protein